MVRRSAPRNWASPRGTEQESHDHPLRPADGIDGNTGGDKRLRDAQVWRNQYILYSEILLIPGARRDIPEFAAANRA